MDDHQLAERALFELAEQVGKELRTRAMMLATAESCTGGWIGEAVTAVPGSSLWFDRGFITYTNEAKQEMLGVSAATLEQHGAVSEPIVREMVSGALQHSRAQVALAISGIAGPGGGTPDKPVGTVWFAWGFANGAVTSEQRHFSGDRREVRRQAVEHGLQGLLERLKGRAMGKTEVLMMLLKAKQVHLEWRSHAEQLIKGMELSDAKAPVDDHSCEFGKWCYGPGKSCLGFLEHYELVLETHHVMHAVYRQIHDLAMQDNLKEAQGRLLELAQASDALLGALELLEQEVLTSPECPD
jgi:nicotinamide-nucleotide amidase